VLTTNQTKPPPIVALWRTVGNLTINYEWKKKKN